jgi:hypothetical protein
VTWYNRVAKTNHSTWETIGIADALSLSLSPLEKNENLLKTIGYFWSDALNCFLFGHRPMTPTLVDVVMIAGLDISSSYPSAFKLSSKTECTNWGAYLNQHIKTKGPVTEKEHTAFLNLWSEHFLFCGPSLAPTRNYLPPAYELAKGNTVGLGKLFLGEVYRDLHSMSLSLLTRRNSGPLVSGGSSSYGLTYTFRTSYQTSLFWPIIPFQIKVGGESGVPVSARLCTVFLAAS